MPSRQLVRQYSKFRHLQGQDSGRSERHDDQSGPGNEENIDVDYYPLAAIEGGREGKFWSKPRQPRTPKLLEKPGCSDHLVCLREH